MSCQSHEALTVQMFAYNKTLSVYQGRIGHLGVGKSLLTMALFLKTGMDQPPFRRKTELLVTTLLASAVTFCFFR